MSLPQIALPRIVMGESRWYIEYKQVDNDGVLHTIRKTHNLNRIKDLEHRTLVAEAIIRDLTPKVQHGYPFRIQYVPKTLIEGLRYAMQIKAKTVEPKTTQTNDIAISQLRAYLKGLDMEHMPLHTFTRRDAILFLDWRMDSGVGARTRNNDRATLRALMNELVEREMIEVNPWVGIKKLPTKAKHRRLFTHEEATAVMQEIRKDKFLMLATVLLYHCGIRPAELRKLRFKLIDLRRGMIYISGEEGKAKSRLDVITIPDSIMDYLCGFGMEKYHREDYIFGSRWEPNMYKQIGRNTINKAHNAILRKLVLSKKLHSSDRLSFYSWKDTAARALVDAGASVVDIMHHFRHKDLNATQQYLQSIGVVNHGVKAIDIRVVDY